MFEGHGELFNVKLGNYTKKKVHIKLNENAQTVHFRPSLQEIRGTNHSRQFPQTIKSQPFNKNLVRSPLTSQELDDVIVQQQ